MDARQALALANPVNRALGDLSHLRTVKRLHDRTLLVLILAVDR